MTQLKNEKGFTLTELIMVVAILGIIATIGTTSLLYSLPTMRLKSAARDIFSTMLQAKAQAVRKGENVTVLFDPANNSYLMSLDPSAVPTPLPSRVTFDPNLVVNGNAHADGVSFANNALVFSPRGIPLHAVTGGLGGGTVGLRGVDSSGATLRQRTIVVSTAGRVKMN